MVKIHWASGEFGRQFCFIADITRLAERTVWGKWVRRPDNAAVYDCRRRLRGCVIPKTRLATSGVDNEKGPPPEGADLFLSGGRIVSHS